jgi:hypothetical protein
MGSRKLCVGEKRMSKRIKRLFASMALVAGMAITSSSEAAFTVTATRTPGTGAYAGLDIVRWFGALSPTGDEKTAGATGLQSAKVTLSFVNPAASDVFQYITGQFAGSPNANQDVAILGERQDDGTARSLQDKGDATNFAAQGTGIFIHDDNGIGFSLQGLFVDGVSKGPGAQNNTGAANGFALFQNAKSFRIEGFVPQPGGGVTGSDSQAFTTSTGPGAGSLFAIAVVPRTATVNALGTLAPDKGNQSDFDVTVPPVPEPATLGLVSIAAVGMLARRRRRA